MNTLSLRPFGQTNLFLSVAGLGTVKFGRNQAVKYPHHFNLPTDKEIRILLEQAQNLGINWLDTAPAYGISEERLGKLIRRQDWIIATKTGEEFENNQSSFNFSSSHTIKSVHRSLKRLKTDYLDIVMIHSNGADLDIIDQSDCITTLQQLKKEGKIRAIGMSCKTAEGALAAMPHIDGLMLTLNPTYLDEYLAIETAHNLHRGIIIKKYLGSGHLLAERSLISLTNFVFKAPITSVIIGTLNPAHLLENAQAIMDATHANAL